MPTTKPLQTLWNDLWAMSFPHFCLGCHSALLRSETEICTACRLHLPYTDHHLTQENPFYKKIAALVPIQYAAAFLYFVKKGRSQQILHHLKYEGNATLATTMGQWFGETLRQANFDAQFDLIIPIPLHASKLKLRGYNQSSAFAQGLSDSLQIPWRDDCMQRVKATATQTRKSRLERWLNVASIFEVTEAAQIAEKNILLVDDVVTTGATLSEGIQALLEAKAKTVSVAAIAAA